MPDAIALTIVVHIVAKPEYAEHVHQQLQTLLELTRAEAGCLQFDLHRDVDDSNHFMLFENWSTEEHWLAHRETRHLHDYREATDGQLASFDLYKMHQTA